MERANPDLVGINISFGEKTYIGGEELDDVSFYEKMRNSAELPKTSSPSPERFMELYKNENHEELLVITLTSKLSSTYSNALLAKRLFLEENPEKRIEVVDSKSGSIGVALMISRCSKLINEGKNMDEILEDIKKQQEHIIFYGVLDTLENAIKGGRVNPIAGKIINILNYKVLIKIDEGVVKPIDKARGEVNSLKKLFDYVKNSVGEAQGKSIVIGHSNCPEKVGKIKKFIEAHYDFKEILTASVGPIMGTYTAEGAILVAVL